MTNRKRLLRASFPVLLIASGLWMLSGCFYLPLPEHRSEHHARDFRKLVGDISSSKRIRPGAITRAEVVGLLGPPQFTSDAPPYRVHGSPASAPSADHSAIGYVLQTDRGVWIVPLCFTALTDTTTRYELRLVFNSDNVLERWDLERSEYQHYHGEIYSNRKGPTLPFQTGTPKLFPIPDVTNP